MRRSGLPGRLTAYWPGVSTFWSENMRFEGRCHDLLITRESIARRFSSPGRVRSPPALPPRNGLRSRRGWISVREFCGDGCGFGSVGYRGRPSHSRMDFESKGRGFDSCRTYHHRRVAAIGGLGAPSNRHRRVSAWRARLGAGPLAVISHRPAPERRGPTRTRAEPLRRLVRGVRQRGRRSLAADSSTERGASP